MNALRVFGRETLKDGETPLGRVLTLAESPVLEVGIPEKPVAVAHLRT